VTTKTLCRRALEAIENYLPILGFIARSTDLEAPVELHGPLLRLTRRAIRSDAYLVIFSEWNYSPFTFLFPELAKRGVVLVGMPRSESHNALIAPLAGHELGHNIWHSEDLEGKLAPEARSVILEKMKEEWARWKDELKLDRPEQLTDLVGFRYWEIPLTWALRQAEETFCDLIGLLIFREAYLYAFRYLLSPSPSVRRAYHYPDLRERARLLVLAAAKAQIPIPNEYEDSFDRAVVEAEPLVGRYVELADHACARLVDLLLERARTLVEDRGLSAFLEADVGRAKDALRRGVPATHVRGVENILIAAWRFLMLDGIAFETGLSSLTLREREVLLNELVLKSFEVFEIECRQGGT
jgi:hypothetical protein